MSSFKNLFIIIVPLLLLCACAPAGNTTEASVSGIISASHAAESVSVQPTAVYPITDVSPPDKDGYITCGYNGVKRKYILYVSEGLRKNAPLVFMMHGYAGNSKSFAFDTGMNAAADKYGFAIVYPQGIRDPKSTNGAAWNSGLGSSSNDDVGFLAALARYLQQTYGFNTRETFAVGLSNGAFMSYKLAVGAPDTFRAVASVAGLMSGGAWNERKDSVSVGILQINGTKDVAVPLDGSMSKSGGYGGAPDVRGIIEYWKNADHLEDYQEVKVSDKTTAYEYSSKQNDNLVWYVQIEGGQHAWPDETLAGFNASEFILEYFKHYVK